MVRWPSADIQEKVHEDRPRGTTPSGELNTTRVAKYSDFGPIEGCVSAETVQAMRSIKLVLLTNRKSLMSFQLVSKSVILNDIERRNGRYFALFQRIR